MNRPLRLRTPDPLWRAIAAILIFFASADAASAEKPADVRVQLGLQGCVKVGLWAPATVESPGRAMKSASIEGLDPQGNPTRFLLNPEPGDGSAHRFRGLFLAGRLEAVPRLHVEFEDGGRLSRRVHVQARPRTQTPTQSEDVPGEMQPALRQSVLIVATVGRPEGFARLPELLRNQEDVPEGAPPSDDASPTVRVLEFDSGEFPVEQQGYDALDAVVLSGPYELDARRDAALRGWVQGGGHLIVCRGTQLDAFVAKTVERGVSAGVGSSASAASASRRSGKRLQRDALLASWLPVTVLAEARVQYLDGLVSFVAKREPIIFSGRAEVARVQNPAAGRYAAGKVLADSSAGPLIVQVPLGKGRVTFCGLNFDELPISNWTGVGALAQRLLEREIEAANTGRSSGGRLSQSGVTDLSTQLHAIQEHFPEVQRMSAWKTMGLLLFYIILIGPLDYLVVHKLLKRPKLTWITFPLLIAGSAVLIVANARELNGDRLRINEFSIVDVDAAAGTEDAARPGRQSARIETWLTLYSPDSRRYNLTVQPQPLASSSAEAGVESAVLGWSGVPEAVYGGLYRPGGVEIGPLPYTLRPDQLAADELPIRLWGSRTLSASWTGSPARLIDARLVREELGRLTGDVTHHFNAPIRDWMLVYGSTIYRPSDDEAGARIAELAPGRPFSPSQPGVSQRGLTDVLTGAFLRQRSERKTGELQTTGTMGQQDYDPTSRDPYNLLRALTFYQQIGGRKYTGLDNVPLRKYDLSPLLPMNRAILIGRIETPAARLIQTEPAGGATTELQPTRSYTFVRIVLPVLHVNE